MATIKQAITLKHQANLGEDPVEVSFAEGDELTVLKNWDDYYLCKSSDGKFFSLPKDIVSV